MRRCVYMIALALLALLGLAGLIASFQAAREQPLNVTTSKPRIVMGPVFIEDGGTREEATCEFDKPLKYLNLIMHWYQDYDELYADYILLAQPADKEEIWGWSNCQWQPEDSWAACDVYAVEPDYVHADMNIDTLGHELFHGACGGYHE